jgi:ATP-binding protein involved in chromosome partitioning
MADLSGAVIVTTPQEVSLGIAKKGLNMFKQVQVPIIGIIENMSGFTCPHCGNTTEIFKRGGGEDMARVLDLPFLGAIPLDPAIMHSAENGVPIISQAVSTPASHAFLQLAENFCHALTHGALGGSVYPVQEELDPETGKFHIQWSDQAQTSHDPYSLRTKCKCALCIDEDTGRQILDPKRVPLDIQINSFNRVGRYAYSFNFSDGHSTGIFTFDRFRDELNERELDSFSV